MKIRDKLTFYFSCAFVLILLAFGFFVYIFSAQFRANEFYNRLKQRIEITEKIFLERESFTQEAFEKIQEQFLNRLPEETEEVIKLSENWQQQLVHSYPDEFISELQHDEEAYFSVENRQGAARIFHLPDGEYAVMITAVDRVGISVLGNMQSIIMLCVAGGIVLITLVSYFISLKLVHPIAQKIQKANAISIRNIHERLNVYNPDDELGQLAIAFNNLLDRLDTAFKAEKLFVANASHEVRNPLTAIIGEAELALDKDRTVAEYQEALSNILIEADRLNGLVNNLLQLSAVGYNPSEQKRRRISLTNLVHEAVNQYGHINPNHRVRIRIDEMDDLEINGNENLLQVAIVNILDNASKFSSNQEVLVTLTRLRDQILVSIKDGGVGIPETDIPKIRQPFFRSENVRSIRGAGIGVPLAIKIVEMHGGRFHVASKLGEGTTVTLSFPADFTRTY